jgi:uncharacterized protein (TIGR00369 family)
MQTAARERTITWSDPFAHLPALAKLSGLEALRYLIAGKADRPPIAHVMNMNLVEADEGRAVFEGTPGEEHYNPIGVVHGGYALTILDSALGCAVHSTLGPGDTYGTIDTHVRMVRPITLQTGRVRAEATIVSVTKTLGTAEGKLFDLQGKLLATGTTACAIKRRA